MADIASPTPRPHYRLARLALLWERLWPALWPAVASGIFEGQLVYWIGPIIGAVAAALLYDSLFIRREPEPVDHGAVRP